MPFAAVIMKPLFAYVLSQNEKGAKPLRRRHVKKHRWSTNAAFTFFRLYYLLILVTVLLFAGLISGSMLAKSGGTGGFEAFLKTAFSLGTGQGNFVNLLVSSFFSTAVLLCAAFLLGMSAFGLPALLCIPIFKGAGIGYSIACLYLQYGLRGVAFSVLCILPGAVLSSIAVIVSSREGIRFSFRIISACSPTRAQVSLWEPLLLCCRKFVACFVFAAAAALVQSLAVMAFSGLLG